MGDEIGWAGDREVRTEHAEVDGQHLEAVRAREALRAQVEPFVPAIVDVIYRAFSIATASTFILGIGAAIVAAALGLFLREVPMQAFEASTTPSKATRLPAVREPS